MFLTTLQITYWHKYYLIYLLIISVIPAALTYEDSPNINRSIVLIIPLSILISIGIYKFITKMRNKKFIIPITIIMILSLFVEFLYFNHQYFIHSVSSKSFLRNDGNREVIKMILEKNRYYTKIYMSGLDYLPIYFLFYQRKFDAILDMDFKNNHKNLTINNVVFNDTWCPSELLNKNNYQNSNVLIIDNGDCDVKSNFEELEVIWRKDSTKAFKLLTPKKIILRE